ncbi:MAG: hypothetical protein HQM10_12595 [Candidatus Riflebacteria bacterium]|nr:hypothetical protein [Candidatus Riflebacteria bacterium]
MKNAFSLVEITISTLLLSLLVLIISNLIQYGRTNFSRQFENSECNMEASLILSKLYNDLDCAVGTTPDDWKRLINSAIFFAENNSINITSSTSSTRNYYFDFRAGELLHTENGQKSRLGEGRLKGFDLKLLGIATNGQIYEITSPSSLPVPSEEKILRVLVKINLEFLVNSEASKDSGISRNFSVCYAPPILNRQLNSIWRGVSN